MALEPVSHLLGLGGFFENLFLFRVQALDAGVVDFFEDAIHLDLQVMLCGHLLFPVAGPEFEFELVSPGLRKHVSGPRRHTRQMYCMAAGVICFGYYQQEVQGCEADCRYPYRDGEYENEHDKVWEKDRTGS